MERAGKEEVPWCRGYHVGFTRRRSPVRPWAESDSRSALAQRQPHEHIIILMDISPDWPSGLRRQIAALIPGHGVVGSNPIYGIHISFHPSIHIALSFLTRYFLQLFHSIPFHSPNTTTNTQHNYASTQVHGHFGTSATSRRPHATHTRRTQTQR